MASPDAIADVIDMFIDAPLQFIPRDTGRTGELWLSVFADIPDPIIRQAGKDYLKSETEWPSPAKLRALAVEVKRHNGMSVKNDTFDPVKDKTIVTVDWCAHITPDGWYAHTYDLARPGRPPTAYEDALSRYPEECTADERAMVEQEYQKRNGEPPLLPPGWEGECSTSSAN